MEILEAFDLTGSYRSAAELAGCDHHTVRRYVQLRGTGEDPTGTQPRAKLIDAFLPKVEELVERSGGRVGADAVHRKLAAMGFAGTERTTRRAVAAAKASYRAGHRRVFRPWIPEPGLWLQWDWGSGPVVGQRATQLWCAWLAWSRFRIVIPVWDKTVPTIVACLDSTLRRLGGAPTYALTDNEKTVTTEHVAGMPVRNPEIVQVSHHYGMTIQTCVPADPQSKGGSEATVRIAKRDVVPTAVNLREQYRNFAELEQACRDFCDEVNHRPHRGTRREPAAMLAEEGQRLHALPAEPFTVAFGTTRRVSWDGTISVEGGKYSVPHPLVDTRVWARFHGDELIVTSIDDQGPHEVARHHRTRPGSPSICEEHYPPRQGGKRAPRPTSADEAAFLALGPGAASWLTEAAAAGTRRIRPKMAEAIALATLHGTEPVDRALGTAAIAGRFADNDLLSILDYQTDHDPDQPHSRADETHSLQRGTAAWSQFGLPNTGGEA